MAFAWSCVMSATLLIIRMLVGGSYRYAFLLWNLALAWLPILFIWYLLHLLQTYRWTHWKPLIITLLWLGFLPNSFYIASDLVHLRATGEVSLLYDAAMFCLFIFNGFALGFTSLLLLHGELLRRIKQNAHYVIGVILLLCSFAIYLGRFLRWNTWDILFNPFGLLFDVSDRLINPAAHEQTFATTAVFFVLLGTTYAVIWQTVAFLRSEKR